MGLKKANQTSFKKGNLPYNKGMYGEKVNNFKNGLPNTCPKHGTHSDWVYYEANRMCACRLCRNERSRLFQSNPSRRINRLLKDANAHAKIKDRECSITLDDLYKLFENQNNHCAISGIEFIPGDKLYDYSLDRIDSKIGYVIGNIQLVCTIINRMKTDLPQHEFIQLCRLVALSAAGKSKKKK